MNQKELFLAAYALISDPNRWCQRAEALDISNYPTDSKSDNACRWCSTGAINRFARCSFVHTREYDDLLSTLSEGLDSMYFSSKGQKFAIVNFNDQNPYEVVIAHWKAVGERMGWL